MGQTDGEKNGEDICCKQSRFFRKQIACGWDRRTEKKTPKTLVASRADFAENKSPAGGTDGRRKKLESKYFRGQTDSGYLQFHKKLVTSAFPMQGVRLPLIRKTAKTLVGDAAFLDSTPSTYEEVMLLAYVLGQSKFDIETLFKRVDGFLPLIDNWAVCDTFVAALKRLGRHKGEVFAHFAPLKDSEKLYDRRFLAVLLMSYFFVDEYIDRALTLLLEIKTGEYYVDMAISWAIATAAAKSFDKAYEIIASGNLPQFIFKKSISKSLESFRLTAEQKAKLRKLRQNA